MPPKPKPVKEGSFPEEPLLPPRAWSDSVSPWRAGAGMDPDDPRYDRNAAAFETPPTTQHRNSARFAETLVAIANILIPFIAIVAVIVGGVYGIRAVLRLFLGAQG